LGVVAGGDQVGVSLRRVLRVEGKDHGGCQPEISFRNEMTTRSWKDVSVSKREKSAFGFKHQKG